MNRTDGARAARRVRSTPRATTTCGRSSSPATAARSVPAPTSTACAPTAGCRTKASTSRRSTNGTRRRRRRRRFARWPSRCIVGVNGLCCGAGLDLVTTGDIVIASERRRVLRSARQHRPGVRPRDGAAGAGATAQRRDAGRAHGTPRAAQRPARVRPRPRHRGGRARRARRRAPRDRRDWSTATRRWPCAARASRSAKGSGSRCTRPSSSPRRSGNATSTPTMRRRATRVPRKPRPRVGSGRVSGELRDHHLDVDRRATRRRRITLNRPDRCSTRSIARCVTRSATRGITIKVDSGVNAVVLRAAGDRAFCAGLDVTRGLRPTRRRVEPRGPGRVPQPEVATGLEAGGVRGARASAPPAPSTS